MNRSIYFGEVKRRALSQGHFENVLKSCRIGATSYPDAQYEKACINRVDDGRLRRQRNTCELQLFVHVAGNFFFPTQTHPPPSVLICLYLCSMPPPCAEESYPSTEQHKEVDCMAMWNRAKPVCLHLPHRYYYIRWTLLDVQPDSSICTKCWGGPDIDGLVDGRVFWFGKFNEVLLSASWKSLWFMMSSPLPTDWICCPSTLRYHDTRDRTSFSYLERRFFDVRHWTHVGVGMIVIVFVVFFLLSAAGQSRTSEGLFPLIYVVSRNLTLLPLRKTFFRLAIQAAL